MARPKRKFSQAERAERRRRDRERLAEAARALLSSEGWRAWLRARAMFHSYSFHNTLLIAHEAGRRGFTPTHVAGFRAWLRLGRCVRKGERGIAIRAPVRVKQRDEDGDETGERRLFFRPVHVWDTLSRDRLGDLGPRRRGVLAAGVGSLARLGVAPNGWCARSEARRAERSALRPLRARRRAPAVRPCARSHAGRRGRAPASSGLP
jgi:hypothetical protein